MCYFCHGFGNLVLHIDLFLSDPHHGDYDSGLRTGPPFSLAQSSSLGLFCGHMDNTDDLIALEFVFIYFISYMVEGFCSPEFIYSYLGIYLLYLSMTFIYYVHSMRC